MDILIAADLSLIHRLSGYRASEVHLHRRRVEMSDSNSDVVVKIVAAVAVLIGFYGLYLASKEGVGSFLLALFIPPWAIIKGLMGLF